MEPAGVSYGTAVALLVRARRGRRFAAAAASNEKLALARAVSRLPPSSIREVRAIVSGDVSTVFFASLDVSVCERVQQYVDAQPSRDSLAGLSGLAFICVGPAFYGFWFFAIRCAFSSV